MAGWHGREAAAMAVWHGREAAAMARLLEKKITVKGGIKAIVTPSRGRPPLYLRDSTSV
jgi:hypothetical protein